MVTALLEKVANDAHFLDVVRHGEYMVTWKAQQEAEGKIVHFFNGGAMALPDTRLLAGRLLESAGPTPFVLGENLDKSPRRDEYDIRPGDELVMEFVNADLAVPYEESAAAEDEEISFEAVIQELADGGSDESVQEPAKTVTATTSSAPRAFGRFRRTGA
jgi:hypothetical protein